MTTTTTIILGIIIFTLILIGVFITFSPLAYANHFELQKAYNNPDMIKYHWLKHDPSIYNTPNPYKLSINEETGEIDEKRGLTNGFLQPQTYPPVDIIGMPGYGLYFSDNPMYRPTGEPSHQELNWKIYDAIHPAPLQFKAEGNDLFYNYDDDYVEAFDPEIDSYTDGQIDANGDGQITPTDAFYEANNAQNANADYDLNVDQEAGDSTLWYEKFMQWINDNVYSKDDDGGDSVEPNELIEPENRKYSQEGAKSDPIVIELPGHPWTSESISPDAFEHWDREGHPFQNQLMYFDLDCDGIPEKLDRNIKGTMIIFYDFNNNYRMDNGCEILYTTNGALSYDGWKLLDSDGDNVLTTEDEGWNNIRISDFYNTWTLEMLDIVEIDPSYTRVKGDYLDENSMYSGGKDNYVIDGAYEEAEKNGFEPLDISEGKQRIQAYNECGATLRNGDCALTGAAIIGWWEFK